MKKFILVTIPFLCLLLCCSKPLITEEETEKYTICFRFHPAPEILPFGETRSMPPINIPEPETNIQDSTDYELYFNQIEYLVYEKETKEFIKHLQFKETDKVNDFGEYLYDRFKPGNYIVCFLTHSSDTVIRSGSNISLEPVSDSFYCYEEIEITPTSSELPIDILLSRIVSRVEFVAKDTVPSQVSSFEMKVEGLYQTLNMMTREVEISPESHIFQHTFTEKERGKDVFNTHAFYTLVPDKKNEILKQVYLYAFSQQKDTVKQTIINQIKIYPNKITRYKGNLYSSGVWDGTFDLTFEDDGKWGGIDENDLDDN